MSTRLGVHVTSGSRNGYGDVAAAAPAVVVAVGEGGALVEAREKSDGRTITVYREQSVYGDAPPGIDQMSEAQARAAADTYWPQLVAKYRLNPADYYQPTNEYGGDNPAGLRNLVAFETRLMELAEQDGLHLAIGSPAGGSPGSWDLWLQFYVPLIRRAFEGGHIYGRHAYGGVEASGNGFLTTSDGMPADDNAGRPFREASYLRAQGIRTPMVITEAGQHGGFQFAGVTALVEDVARYDALCRQHENIWGFCAWTYGSYREANIEAASGALAAYLQAQGGAVRPTYPEESMTRGQPRTQYPRTYNVIPDDATEAEAVAIFLEGWRRSRETAGGSYDDAGVGDLDTRRANLYGKAGERAAFEAWYAEHYPGVQLAFPPVPGRVEPSPVPTRATLCDVSSHQGIINFTQMATRAAGCYMRGSIGRAGLDTRFAANWQAIRATGMKRGMYHLWRSDATAEQNLANIVAVTNQHGAGDLRIAIDVEPTTDLPRINGNEVGRLIPLFRAQFGYEPVIYTGLWVRDRVDGDRSWFDTSLLWLANYWSQPPQPGQYPTIPAGNTLDRLLMHQWTSSYYDGRTWGVSSVGLDVNVAYDLNRLLVTGSAPPPPPPPSTAIDLLPYIRGDGRAYMVRHPSGAQEKFRTEVDGPWFYLVKNNQWEQFRADDAYIWRGLDTSPGPAPDYAERPGALRFYVQQEPGTDAARWCKRYMSIGETWTGPGHHVQFRYKSDCSPSAANSGAATNRTRLVARHASKTWNGITVPDVIEMDGGPGSAERFFYARTSDHFPGGLVAWEAAWGSSAVSELNVAGDNARERLCS